MRTPGSPVWPGIIGLGIIALGVLLASLGLGGTAKGDGLTIAAFIVGGTLLVTAVTMIPARVRHRRSTTPEQRRPSRAITDRARRAQRGGFDDDHGRRID
ncbi:hypothetical protein [Microbacterium sp. 18062]|uniref:hypothetical protein n=1 Tax=Microbacterium sp. 18062 TaxID=2681410 RepID=UPI001357F6D8|nr:hypothetical protein [Microbacterium sp. 18062]